MPADAVKIDRSTRWGNPFRIGEQAPHPVTGRPVAVDSAEQAVALFALYLYTRQGEPLARAARTELKGKSLACWCRLGQPCHGDVLLTVANKREP
jgi:hypothetical protein